MAEYLSAAQLVQIRRELASDAEWPFLGTEGLFVPSRRGLDQPRHGMFLALVQATADDDQLVEWYERLLAELRFRGFPYEDHGDKIALTAAEAAGLNRLLDACGLVWDSRVLDFHRTERGVITASAAQVRRPVYADSVGTSAAYRAHLAPLADALRTEP